MASTQRTLAKASGLDSKAPADETYSKDEVDAQLAAVGGYAGSVTDPTYAGGVVVARPPTVPAGKPWHVQSYTAQPLLPADPETGFAGDVQWPTPPHTARNLIVSNDGTTVIVSFDAVLGMVGGDILVWETAAPIPDAAVGTTLAGVAPTQTIAYSLDAVANGRRTVTFPYNAPAPWLRLALQPAALPGHTAEQATAYRSAYSAEAAVPAAGTGPGTVVMTGPTTAETTEDVTYAITLTGGEGTGTGGNILQADWSYEMRNAQDEPVPGVTIIPTYGTGNRNNSILVTMPGTADEYTVVATFAPFTGPPVSDMVAVTVSAPAGGGAATDSLVDLTFAGAAGDVATVANAGSLGGVLTAGGGVITLDGAGLGTFPGGVNGTLGANTLASDIGKTTNETHVALYMRAVFTGGGNGIAMLGGGADPFGFGITGDFFANIFKIQNGGGNADATVGAANPEEVELFANITGSEDGSDDFFRLYLRRSGETAWTEIASAQATTNSVTDGPFSLNGRPSLSPGDRLGKGFRRAVLWRKRADGSDVTVANVDALLAG